MKKKFLFFCFSVLFTGTIVAQTQYNATTYHQFNTNYGYIQVGAQDTNWAHIYSDRPNFIFNKPVYSMNGFFSYNRVLNLEAASGYYVQIQPRSSSYGLILREYNSSDYGNIEVTSSGLGLGYNTDGSSLMINSRGNIGIGTISPGSKYKLNVAGIIYARDGLDIPANSLLTLGVENASTGHIKIHNASCCYNTFVDLKGNLYFRDESTSSALSIQKNGTVTVGVTPKYSNSVVDTKGNKFMVNGGIYCESLTIDADVPNSDYVFEKDYNLLEIMKLEQFVLENKHLPGVPSAKEFKKNGYNVGEMDDILLRKIEELTLYIIYLNKKNEGLRKKLAEMRNLN